MVTRGKALRVIAYVLFITAISVIALYPSQAVQAAQLPLLALFSLLRMIAAYLLALLFAISYGTIAATNRRASTVMLPLLDVLQSVPILGFFPAALVFFVTTFNGHPIGLEFAVVFLIFTSMAWNMAFGVYESISTIPHDLESASAVFGVKSWLRFRRLILPAAMPKLVYNSILSWTNGWFFLVASEIFTAFGQTYTRPGIGSFIANAGVAGDAGAIVVGLGVLAAVVLSLDAFLWRPLSLWSTKFRIEAVSGESQRAPAPFERFAWLPRFPGVRRRIARRLRPIGEGYLRASSVLDRAYTAHPKIQRTIFTIDLVIFVFIFTIVTIAGLAGLAGMFLRPLPPAASEIPMAALSSFSRLLLAYGIATAWTIPMAVWLGRSKRAARYMTPILEVLASIPATALLPVIIGVSVLLASSIHLETEVAAFLIALFSMQWYLLFNLISGVRSIPNDMDDAARVFGLRGATYWKRVILPAITPSFLTGSITAWGAGWNALIVSEYIRFGERLYQVEGIGAILNRATFSTPPDNELLLLAILTMVAIVLAMNKLLWRPLFNRASRRFRMEVQ